MNAPNLFEKLSARYMIDGCFAVCFDLPEKKWMAIDSVALNRFHMALLILIFVPFASASGSISTWLSVFQLCELITGFVILKSFLRFIFYHDKFFFKISSSMPIFELPIKSIYYL